MIRVTELKEYGPLERHPFLVQSLRDYSHQNLKSRRSHQETPQQIVHPMQKMHYVKEQIQPPPPPPQIMATQDTFSHMYMPREWI